MRAHLGGTGGGLLELAGVFREEPWPLAAPLALHDGQAGSAEVGEFVEVLTARTAEPLWSASTAPLEGRPVVTHRALGHGGVWYVGGLLDDETLAQVVADAAEAAGLALAPLPEGVEAIRRGQELLLMNHSAHPVNVRILGQEVEVQGEDLVICPLG